MLTTNPHNKPFGHVTFSCTCNIDARINLPHRRANLGEVHCLFGTSQSGTWNKARQAQSAKAVLIHEIAVLIDSTGLSFDALAAADASFTRRTWQNIRAGRTEYYSEAKLNDLLTFVQQVVLVNTSKEAA